ncbi:hypothetical protein GCM10009619_42350 [Williamsia maris]
MNPECLEMCTFDPNVAGQKPLFCSAKCRVAFGAKRRKLVRQLEALDEVQRTTSMTQKEARRVAKVQSYLRWLLERYPSDRA